MKNKTFQADQLEEFLKNSALINPVEVEDIVNQRNSNGAVKFQRKGLL